MNIRSQTNKEERNFFYGTCSSAYFLYVYMYIGLKYSKFAPLKNMYVCILNSEYIKDLLFSLFTMTLYNRMSSLLAYYRNIYYSSC